MSRLARCTDLSVSTAAAFTESQISEQYGEPMLSESSWRRSRGLPSNKHLQPNRGNLSLPLPRAASPRRRLECGG